jgi:uncharacterized protein YukE
MADLFLDPDLLGPVKTGFQKNEHDMEDAIANAKRQLDYAKEHLAGYTTDAWSGWQSEFDTNYKELQREYNAGLKALDRMEQEIIEADLHGATYFKI